MSLSMDPYVWIAAILTLGVFSFLWADNPFFCLIEHLLVGLSTGYIFCTYWFNVFEPELIRPLWENGLGSEAHLWVALLLCVFWACKWLESARDLYRLALAFWVSVDLGLQIPTYMDAQVIAQIAGTIDVSFAGPPVEMLGNAVLVAGTVAALIYFYFSKPHEGAVGSVAGAGLLILMTGFGATFGYTVLSRVYLLIGRLVFLFRDWLGLIG